MSVLKTNQFTIQTNFPPKKIKMYRTKHIRKYREKKQEERQRLAKARRKLLGLLDRDEKAASEDKRGTRDGYKTKRERKFDPE